MLGVLLTSLLRQTAERARILRSGLHFRPRSVFPQRRVANRVLPRLLPAVSQKPVRWRTF